MKNEQILITPSRATQSHIPYHAVLMHMRKNTLLSLVISALQYSNLSLFRALLKWKLTPGWKAMCNAPLYLWPHLVVSYIVNINRPWVRKKSDQKYFYILQEKREVFWHKNAKNTLTYLVCNMIHTKYMYLNKDYNL